MTFNRDLAIAVATLCLLAPCASGGVINYALDKPATASSSYSDGVTWAIELATTVYLTRVGMVARLLLGGRSICRPAML